MTITIKDNSYNRLVGMDDPADSIWKDDSKSWKDLVGQELEIISEPKTVQIDLSLCGTFTYQVIQVKDLDGLFRWVLYACLEKDGKWRYLYPEQFEPEFSFPQIKIVL